MAVKAKVVDQAERGKAEGQLPKQAGRRAVNREGDGRGDQPRNLETAPNVVGGAAIGAVAGSLVAAVRGDTARATAAAAALGGLAGAGLGYVASVRQKYRVNRAQFARLSGVSERTLGAWEREGPKEGSNLRPITELDRLHEGLSRVVKPEAIGPWLETPNRAFEGFKPIEIIERGQSDRIWRMIYEMEMNTAF